MSNGPSASSASGDLLSGKALPFFDLLLASPPWVMGDPCSHSFLVLVYLGHNTCVGTRKLTYLFFFFLFAPPPPHFLFSGTASLLLFQKDLSEQQDQIRTTMALNRRRRVTSGKLTIFKLPPFAKDWGFWMLVAFQFLFSIAYLTPIYSIESMSNLSKKIMCAGEFR